MSEKSRGLLIDIIVYIAAFGAAAAPYMFIENIFAATAVFTAAATAVVFIATVVYSDVSVYDPYWSVAPVVMILFNMIKYRLWNVNAFIVLAIISVWSVRLTANWYITYKGVGHEDWRYAEYRQKYKPFVFQLISFTGLQFIPTIVVYASLVSGLCVIQDPAFSPLSLIGAAVMLSAVLLEFISDRAIHRFLKEHKEERKTCDVSVWKYSRHPNYLGEISFWIGLYIYFFAACPQIWYYGLGVLTVVLLFLFVSIPLMEKHNMKRRADYAEYKAKTSRLLLLPNKK